MARYIDADRLIDYIDKNVVCTSRDSEECKQFMIEHLAMEFFAPTADVVPKSEVERLEHLRAELSKEVERLQKALDEYEETSGLKQAKTEVAREIFEEIEKLSYYAPTPYDDEINVVDYEDIAELKKKYTEGKT